jgi:hypothetical protein
MEAEYVAMSECITQMIWLRNLLREINEDPSCSLFCDNQAAIQAVKNQASPSKAKHIEIRYHFIKDLVNGGDMKIRYIPSKENLADVMTKALSKSIHHDAAQMLRVRGLPLHAPSTSDRRSIENMEYINDPKLCPEMVN